ncbi:MAG: pyrroline-5-carboxylate reductase [Sphingomonadales bacterium]
MTFFSEITSESPLLLIGAGNMGGAMLKGWVKAGLKEGAVVAVDPRGEEAIRTSLGLQKIEVLEHLVDYDPSRVPRLIVFAVKPQFMADVFQAAHSIPLGNTLLVSVAAGKRIETFEEKFGKSFPIVRIMPNTPAAIGKGISAIFGNPAATDQDLDNAEELAAVVGEVVRVPDENAIDIVTCLSGSGPAYFYYFIEALAEAGFAAGLNEDLAYQLAKETFIGSAALMQITGEEAAPLRQKVTSPGGTTEAALGVMMKDEALAKLIEKAVLTAVKRSRELSD